MDPLLNIPGLPPLQPLDPTGAAKPATTDAQGASFNDLLKQALQEVGDTQAASEQEARNLMTGEPTDMHSAILAVQKADVSFQMMMAVRSKLIEAYREVMRMQM